MRWIPSLLKLIFTSSSLLVVSTTFSQSDTTFSKIKIYENSSSPDTVIIERIKVQKERVYIVKRDTVVKTDTVIQVKKETIVQTDTVLVFKPRNTVFSLGLGFGSSLDYDHTQYWNIYEEYYQKQKQDTHKRLNWNVELLGRLEFSRWHVSVNTGVTRFYEQLNSSSQKNSLTYFHATAVPFYHLLKRPKYLLSVGIGSGLKTLVEQSGMYINPDKPNEISAEAQFFPTNQTLWVLTARLEAKIRLTNKLELVPQLRFENHPTSITTVDHPILFWRDSWGFNTSLLWKI